MSVCLLSLHYPRQLSLQRMPEETSMILDELLLGAESTT
jgi:hypothetical protein